MIPSMKPSPPKELPVAKNSKSSKKNTVAKNKTATKAKKTAKKVTKAKTKSTKKVVKKAGKKVAKKTARKVAKKTTKKVAKKTAKKVAKKTAKKVAKKTAKKVVKKAALPAKKTSQKVVTKAKPAPAKAEAKKTPAAKKTAPAAAPAVEAARTEATDLPQVGEHAPEFVLSTDDGTTVSLRDYLGKKNVVLYFYPKDDTPGCTKEACTFQEHMDHFTATDTVIVGVSPDDTVSHGKFRKKYNLGFPLGADVDNSVATSYGVWGEKSMYGRTYMGVTRATFLINKHGKIAAVWPKVKVDGHSEEVQAAITGLST